jgi:hypothetical protein
MFDVMESVCGVEEKLRTPVPCISFSGSGVGIVKLGLDKK